MPERRRWKRKREGLHNVLVMIAEVTSGKCGIQGFFLAISAMITAFYFFFICLNLFLVVTLEVHMERYKW
jgi:hypothetical protein